MNYEILKVSEAAKRKGVSRQTIYNNLDSFDWNSGRIINNKRFNNWQPDKRGSSKRVKNN